MRPGQAAALPGGPISSAAPTGAPWHYRLLLAKQADLVDTTAVVEVKVPYGWKVSGSAAWFRVSGTVLGTTGDGTVVRLSTPLKQDVLLDVTLTKV